MPSKPTILSAQRTGSNTTERAQETRLPVILNGQSLRTSARTLSDLVAEQGHGDAKIATAVNGEFVPARARCATELGSGDRIEIVSARQGG